MKKAISMTTLWAIIFQVASMLLTIVFGYIGVRNAPAGLIESEYYGSALAVPVLRCLLGGGCGLAILISGRVSFLRGFASGTRSITNEIVHAVLFLAVDTLLMFLFSLLQTVFLRSFGSEAMAIISAFNSAANLKSYLLITPALPFFAGCAISACSKRMRGWVPF